MKRGWPVGALLITVVRQSNGEGHAVLTVVTDRGDLVLDNLNDQIALWSNTPYDYIKRQSSTNTGAWMAIDDARGLHVGSVAK
jgi:predicted transglutaminase-like cysteine proteinase